MINFHNLLSAICNLIFFGNQYHFIYKFAFFKLSECVIQNWSSKQIHILLLYLTVHSFAAPCCQNDRRVLFFHLAFPQFQIRNCIQIQSGSCSCQIFIISCHSDHRCIICTENRGRMVKFDTLLSAGFFHCHAKC